MKVMTLFGDPKFSIPLHTKYEIVLDYISKFQDVLSQQTFELSGTNFKKLKVNGSKVTRSDLVSIGYYFSNVNQLLIYTSIFSNIFTNTISNTRRDSDIFHDIQLMDLLFIKWEDSLDRTSF